MDPNVGAPDVADDPTSLRQKGVCLAALEISIRTPTLRDAEALASLLCRDMALRQSLGIAEADQPSGATFLEKISHWCERNSALTLAIVDVDGQALGTISLSNINEAEHTARIGYWLASDHWGEGYTSQAFALALWLARMLGIHRVFAWVDKDNAASLRIWRRYEATDRPGGGEMLECTIDLHNTSPAYARLLAVLREIGFPLEGDAPADA